ncbi:MAG: hypothetical protein ACF8R7_12025 [Phycisphaerales bacterium JB039]
MFASMESLEARMLLSSHLDHEIFYPEGYAHDGVGEAVEIANLTGLEAEFELWARYERGQRDQLLVSGALAGGQRDSIVITEQGRSDTRLVRTDVPYALVLRSSEPLAAEFKHDDFGGETSEAFTDRTAERWALTNLTRDDDNRAFVVFYNPFENEVEVELELYDDSGQTFKLKQTVGGQRRGGWNLNDTFFLPRGRFAALIDASSPISLARSEYSIGQKKASGSLGIQNAGDLAGAILSLEFEKRLAPGGPSASVADTTITIFNTSDQAADVRLTFLSRDDSRTPGSLPELTVSVDSHERRNISLRDLGFGEREEVSVMYQSDQAVAVAAFIERAGGIFGLNATTQAAQNWRFFDGLVDRIQRAELRTEDVLLFNPTGRSVDVTVRFHFGDGRIITETKSLEAFEVDDVDARLPLLTLPGMATRFMITIESEAPIVTSLEHWGLAGPDGFAAPYGVVGTGVPMASLLS